MSDTDADPAHVDEPSGDGPDTIDDRIVVIVRLIDTADEETTEGRRLLRRLLILRLITHLQQDFSDLLQEQLDRLGDVDG